MKPSQTRPSDERRQRAQATVEKHLLALFERMPMLCGFAVRHDLELTEVSVSTWPGYTAGLELYEDLVQAIADLADERPEAIELLRGRTFARAFH
jgi:hypothetical protein